MTPQEAKLIDELFDRVASLENAPRDAEAVRMINEGLKRAPNALYPMVQTVLVQDEALKRANARIQELQAELGVEPGQPAQQTGFLDSMRDALLGKPQGSVPSVRPGAVPSVGRSPWGNAGQPGGYAAPPQAPMQAPMQSPMSSGGSFLGTAAATAAGVVGGALLMNSMRGLFGGHEGGAAHSAFDSGASGGSSPWSTANDSGLARDAGIDSIGRQGTASVDGDGTRSAGLFDALQDDNSDFDNSDDSSFDVGGDSGGDGGNDAA
jgi:uncharacterized protein